MKTKTFTLSIASLAILMVPILEKMRMTKSLLL